MDKLKPCPVCGNHILSFVTGIATPKFAFYAKSAGKKQIFLMIKIRLLKLGIGG